MQFALSDLPPTPTPSIPSPSRRDSEEPPSMANVDKALPSTPLPPTPPVMEDEEPKFNLSAVPQRPRRGRRPASIYPGPGEEQDASPVRDFSNPQQLDVDLDAYSTNFEDGREPTLSFVTTSTVESTAGTPPSIAPYEFKPEAGGKAEGEQRIRVRTKTGRADAYSSAESSMGSGAYSYHAYADNVYHPHPPPLPIVPSAFTPEVGLGITAQDLVIPARQRESQVVGSPSSDPPISPPNSFAHRPWKRDVITRLRSDSASSSITTTSASTNESAPPGSPSRLAYPFGLWDEEHEESTPEAVALVEEGREKIFNVEKLNAMCGVEGLTESVIRSMTGITHLLLPGVGIQDSLSLLLDILAPTLVVLDISNNDLSFLPETLARCNLLEELNISGNPVRSLPLWMGDLVGLRMLMVDGCRLQSIPLELSTLSNLHTMCARRNRLVCLPSWLCLLNQLETLRVDDNPFAKEWQPIVAPILQSTLVLAAVPPRTTSQKNAESLKPIAEDHTPTPPGIRKMRSTGALLDQGQPEKLAPIMHAFGVKPVSRDMQDTATSSTVVPPSSNRFRSLGAREGRRTASVFDDSEGKDKPGKWGFLRKMSVHRLKSDMPSGALAQSAALMPPPPNLVHAQSDVGPSGTSRQHVLPRSISTVPLKAEADEFGTQTQRSMPRSLGPSTGGLGAKRGKRRSFLPIDIAAPSINIAIPATSPFLPNSSIFESPVTTTRDDSNESIPRHDAPDSPPPTVSVSPPDPELESRYATGLESIKSYLRDLYDLSRLAIEPYGGFEVVGGDGSVHAMSTASDPISPSTRGSISEARRAGLQPSPEPLSRNASQESFAEMGSGKKFKDDKAKRARVIREIYDTERTYVRGLGELVAIYVKPASQNINPGKGPGETIVPAPERKVVFGGIESILSIHRDNLLPALERAAKPLLEGTDSDNGDFSVDIAHAVGEVFRTYIAYMKQYSTYINNFDNALSRMKTWTAPITRTWTAPTSGTTTPAFGSKANSPVSTAAIGVGLSAGLGAVAQNETVLSGSNMTTAQRKRVKTFLKRRREHPMHSQINLESYLLLPIQRVPRYKLLLEDLAMCTPPSNSPKDTLDDALNEIASLASLMNEEKRDADSRLRLFHWQQRISSRGPSPLVQPHRKLILDGALTLIRLVKKASSFVEVDNTVITDAEQTITASKIVVPVDYIAPEPMDRSIMLILCTDLLVLVQKQHAGDSWDGQVDLFNVLRMSTLREPASMVHGSILRVVDNKSIYYFNGGNNETTLKWYRAINSARRK